MTLGYSALHNMLFCCPGGADASMAFVNSMAGAGLDVAGFSETRCHLASLVPLPGAVRWFEIVDTLGEALRVREPLFQRWVMLQRLAQLRSDPPRIKEEKPR